MSRTTLLAVALLTSLWLAPQAARADDVGEGELVEIPTARVLQPSESGAEMAEAAYTGRLAARDWASRRAWGYGTQNLYPLTRGMTDAGIPRPARWVLYPFTAVFDTGNLAFGAIAGLYGD